MGVPGFIGFIVMVVMIAAGLLQIRLGPFVDSGSLLITCGVTAAALLMAYGSGCWTATAAVFRRNASREALALAVAVFERGKSFAVASGVVGTFIGVIIMLKNLDDPARVGPGLALASLTTAYGVLLAYGVYLPVCASLRRRLQEADGSE